MYSACVTEVNENLKRSLIKSLEFIEWKKRVKKDSTVFIKPNFTFPYYKEGITTNSELLKNLLKIIGNDNGVIHVNKPEDTLKKAIELIENGSIEEEGRKARKFVEKYSWDDIVDEFEGILEEIAYDEKTKDYS